MQKILKGKNSVDRALDYLYSIPAFKIKKASVHHEIEKSSGEMRGKIKISLDLYREERKSTNKKEYGNSFTLVLVVGSYKQRMLLAESSLVVSRTGTWTVTKELDFDWQLANANAGEGNGKVVLRLLWEEVRGLDAEMVVPLK